MSNSTKKNTLILIALLIILNIQKANAIINGQDAPESELPFFSQIHFKIADNNAFSQDRKDAYVNNSWNNQCGGILYSYNYVITAKHCIMGGNGSLEDIRVSYLGEPGRLFEVESIYTPPVNYYDTINYFPNSPDSIQINYKNGDIALLKIKGTDPTSAHSLTAQEMQGNSFITAMETGETGAIYGMGLTERDKFKPRTDTVKMLDVISVDSLECSEENGKTLKGNPYIGYQANKNYEICVRSLLQDQVNRTAYTHDSGGPLLLKHGRYYSLAGIISHSLWKDYYYPEKDLSPALTLTKVNTFKNWINNVIYDSSDRIIEIVDMRETYEERDLIAINNEVYLHNTAPNSKQYEKIDYVNGKLSRNWQDDLALTDNQLLAFTKKDKFVIDVTQNSLSTYNLINKSWGASYFHEFSELGQVIDAPTITDSGINLLTKSGSIYNAKILSNGNLFDLKRANLPPLTGLKNIYSYIDYTGYRYYALDDKGNLWLSNLTNEWRQVSFSGLTSKPIEKIAFGHEGQFCVKINKQWYYNNGFVNSPKSGGSNLLVDLKKLTIVDKHQNTLKIHSLALSNDNKKIYALGDINNKFMLTVSHIKDL
ncbi:trypsin-like serine protease [Aeromonas jandaei]|uniref:trypsin-like serine protease n=1 Tax=Aeromonas jandaei TaxID=650 RepID=UPI00191E6DA1|nr:trypsin-like serine protease [Aeromonas jandaei]MBL0611609.1 trypsin-like serine protease [Aeromonas jandaei]